MSKMQTVERPQDAIEIERRGSRTGLITAVVAVVALVLGVLAGYALGSDSDGDQRAYVVDGEMTERHEQMLDMVDEFFVHAKAGDGDALAAMFTTRGLWELRSDVIHVADGTLAEEFNANRLNPSASVLEPLVMDDYRVMFFIRLAGGNYTNMIEFTDIGELKIVRYVFGVDQTLTL